MCAKVPQTVQRPQIQEVSRRFEKNEQFSEFNLISLFSYFSSGFQRTTSYRRPKAALVPGSDLGLLALLPRLGHAPAPDCACCSHWPVVLVSFPQARKGFILACRLQSIIWGGEEGGDPGPNSRQELK